MSPDLDPYAPPRLEVPAGQSTQPSDATGLVASVHFESERRLFRQALGIRGTGTVRLEPWGLTLNGQTISMKGRALRALSVILCVGALALFALTWTTIVVGPALIIVALVWIGGGRLYKPATVGLPWNEVRSIHTYGAGLWLETARGDLMLFPQRSRHDSSGQHAALQQIGAAAYQRVPAG